MGSKNRKTSGRSKALEATDQRRFATSAGYWREEDLSEKRQDNLDDAIEATKGRCQDVSKAMRRWRASRATQTSVIGLGRLHKKKLSRRQRPRRRPHLFIVFLRVLAARAGRPNFVGNCYHYAKLAHKPCAAQKQRHVRCPIFCVMLPLPVSEAAADILLGSKWYRTGGCCRTARISIGSSHRAFHAASYRASRPNATRRS